MYNKKPTYKKSSAKDKHTVAVVKSVLNREIETKSAMVRITGLALTEGLTYASNVCSAITQGTTADQVVGEKLFLKNINFKMNLKTNSAAVPKALRVLIVSSKDKLQNTNAFALIANSSIWRAGVLPADLTLAHPDLHKLDVHYDHTFTFNPSLSASDAQRRDLQIRVPFNRSMYIEADNGLYFKNKNIYMVCTAYQSGGLNVPVELDTVCAINFRDA